MYNYDDEYKSGREYHMHMNVYKDKCYRDHFHCPSHHCPSHRCQRPKPPATPKRAHPILPRPSLKDDFSKLFPFF